MNKYIKIILVSMFMMSNINALDIISVNTNDYTLNRTNFSGSSVSFSNVFANGSMLINSNVFVGHTNNQNIHITSSERINWNGKAETSITNGFATTNYVNNAFANVPPYDNTKIVNLAENLFVKISGTNLIMYAVTYSNVLDTTRVAFTVTEDLYGDPIIWSSVLVPIGIYYADIVYGGGGEEFNFTWTNPINGFDFNVFGYPVGSAAGATFFSYANGIYNVAFVSLDFGGDSYPAYLPLDDAGFYNYEYEDSVKLDYAQRSIYSTNAIKTFVSLEDMTNYLNSSIANFGSMAYQGSNSINVVTGNFEIINFQNGTISNRTDGLGINTNVHAEDYYLNLNTAVWPDTTPVSGATNLVLRSGVQGQYNQFTRTFTVPETIYNEISPVSTSAVTVVTLLPYTKIYKIETSNPLILSNDLSNITVSDSQEASWETWINFTTTNSLSVVWRNNIEWINGQPSLTVTGQYKFAFSTINGTNLIGKQVYPTVYEWQGGMSYARNGNTPSSPIMWNELFLIAETNTYAVLQVSHDFTKPVIFKFGYYVYSMNGATNPISIRFGLGVPGSLLPLLTKASYSTTNFFLTPFLGSSGEGVPASLYVPVLEKHNVTAITPYIYISKIFPASRAVVSCIQTRNANELEIKAYSQGWRP